MDRPTIAKMSEEQTQEEHPNDHSKQEGDAIFIIYNELYTYIYI